MVSRVFMIAWSNIFIIAALKSLSSHLNLCVISAWVCVWTAFSWELRFFWFFTCCVIWDHALDALNIILWDTESCLILWVVWIVLFDLLGLGCEFLPTSCGLPAQFSRPCSAVWIWSAYASPSLRYEAGLPFQISKSSIWRIVWDPHTWAQSRVHKFINDFMESLSQIPLHDLDSFPFLGLISLVFWLERWGWTHPALLCTSANMSMSGAMWQKEKAKQRELDYLP